MRAIVCAAALAVAVAAGAAELTTPKADPVQDARLQALQTDVQLFKDFTQNILATVYFSLGTVVVVLFAMVGFGWYQNFRAYERDKEAMRQALMNGLTSRLSEGTADIELKAAERFQAFDQKMADALELSFKGISDLQLMLEVAVFHAAHNNKKHRVLISWCCKSGSGLRSAR